MGAMNGMDCWGMSEQGQKGRDLAAWATKVYEAVGRDGDGVTVLKGIVREAMAPGLADLWKSITRDQQARDDLREATCGLTTRQML